MRRLIGILGGTFDPIHYGHIRLALEAQEQLDLDHVRLIPVYIPPHRTNPVATPEHRRAMIELAINDAPDLCIDVRELKSQNISYTINTLKSLRQEFIDDALFLIVGRDTFNKIDGWKDWQELLDYTHIIVANRPGDLINDISNELKNWIEKYKTNECTLLKNSLAGTIYFIDIPLMDISSSMIRLSCSEHNTADDLLPATTLTYINHNHLYQDTA